jgi:hypothetical protein
MFYLLLLFSLVTLGAGVFLLGFGLPIRETVFGSALLVSGTVALVGTFLLIGLAVAVRELQRVVHGIRRMPRPPRQPERKEGERRPPSHRSASSRAHADAPIPPPTSIDEPLYEGHHEEARPDARVAGAPVRGEPEGRPDPRPPARRPGPEWLRRAISEIEPVSGEPAPPEPLETHHPDPYHRDEPRRHGDAPYARPGAPGPERPAMQEGWLRPRAGSPPPIEPEDYAPEPPPDLRMRPRMPPAAQFEPPPPYEREPEPAPDVRMRPRMPPAPQLEPPPPQLEAAPVHEPEPEPEPTPRQPPAPPPNIFDIVWPSERRRPANAPEPQPEPQPAPAVRPGEIRPLPPVQPVPMPGPIPAPPMAAPRPEPPRPELRPEPPRPEPRPEPPRAEQRPEPFRPEPLHPEPLHPEPLHPEPLQPEYLRPESSEPRPVSVLKSGVIDEMAYTLFTDGSIEAQMPDGTMRFGSIEELRRHLEQAG